VAAVEEVGKDRRAAGLFGAYWGQYGRHDEARTGARLDDMATAGDVTGRAIVSATSEFVGDAGAVARIEGLIARGWVERTFVGVALRRGGWRAHLTQQQFRRVLAAVVGPDFANVSDATELLTLWLSDGRPLAGRLADYAWRCLEHPGALPPTGVGFYAYDRLAAALTKKDPARGFALLEWTLRQPLFRARSYPLGRGYGDAWWETLRALDRRRVVETVLTAALEDPTGDGAIAWRLRDRVDQEGDADILTGWGLESEGHAVVVAGGISAGRPGFWPIATALIDAYPEDGRVRSRLTMGARELGEDVYVPYDGPWEAYAAQCRIDIDIERRAGMARGLRIRSPGRGDEEG
jgi:hypothetical protein